MDHFESNSSQGRSGADDFAAGYTAATQAAGVRILTDRAVVRVTGDDRAPFLHGMCSADIKGAKAGTVLPALILTEHAHVIAELFVWVADDALLLDIDVEGWGRARPHLEKLLVADDVEFDDTNATAVIDAEGPRCAAAARTIAGDAAELPAEWRFVAADGVRIGNLARFGGPAVAVLAPRERADEIAARMVSAVPGARRIGETVIEAIRIENGIARAGIDTGEKTIALEARMERAISFSKGCYVGQETIERATARGALKKRLLGLKLEGTSLPAAGAPVTQAGKEVGHITSAALSPRFGAIGLAILHHSAWTPGTQVSAGNRDAEVCELPFGNS
ncbi:MAG: YgfZ/GcvT domain-containing protein [Candidatus Binataceae bacterium]